MTTIIYGYDINVEGPVVSIRPGHMLEFVPSSPLQPLARRSMKHAFEAAFDEVAQKVVENLLHGPIQLKVTGMDPVWAPYFRDAIERALKTHNEGDRNVSLA